METVLVVGHNPAMAELTSLLADGEGSRGARARWRRASSTSGLAVLRYAGAWDDLDARLVRASTASTSAAAERRRVRSATATAPAPGVRCRCPPSGHASYAAGHDADA